MVLRNRLISLIFTKRNRTLFDRKISGICFSEKETVLTIKTEITSASIRHLQSRRNKMKKINVIKKYLLSSIRKRNCLKYLHKTEIVIQVTQMQVQRYNNSLLLQRQILSTGIVKHD